MGRFIFAAALLFGLAGAANGQMLQSIVGGGYSSGGGGGSCPGSNYRLCANTAKGSTSSGTVTTDAIDTSGADLIVVGVSEYSGGSGFCTPTDNKSNSPYIGTTAQTSATAQRIRLFYFQAPTVGSGHTFTCTDTAGFPAIVVAAFAGSIASPLDQGNGAVNNVTIATTLQTGSVTPTNTNQLLVTVISTGTSGTYSIDSSFITDATFQSSFSGGNSEGLAMAYLIETSIVAQNPTWTYATGTEAATTIATFKSH